uniref:AAA+ ATPase domain-containing protein n=1 Tax=Mantoniella antarctica TaxID=81844 RepID=A0A7S0XH10_9CHLO|mmetsp:Transcript_9168/g.22581  ORF Transcript_9168/g.22581 Transcript_9168/m.22581 type:complete len:378 (+) Transcript_9168:214-1347(+)
MAETAPPDAMAVDESGNDAPQVGDKRKRKEPAESDEGVMRGKGKGTAEDAKKNQMWVEKYRPAKLADVAAHKDIIDTISRLTKEDKLPHLLLYGPPGTGKTSTILAVARELYGTSFGQMTLELNASDDRGIDVVRNEVQAFASTMRFNSTGFKLIILDECDSMTKDAQFALRRIIEKYTKHTRFCLIGNYVGKIIPALQSRCTRFRFAPLGPESVRERVQHVVDAEALDITPEGISAVQHLGGGDMRRTLNILQASWLANAGDDSIDADAIYATTGQPRPQDIEAIAGVLLNSPFQEAVEKVSAIKTERGLALADITRLLCEYVFRLHMPPPARAELVSQMADVEHRLAYVTHERLQLLALVGAFNKAKESLVLAAK